MDLGIGEGILHLNTTRVLGLDPTNAFDLSKAEMIGREQVYEMVDFLKSASPAFKNANVVSVANEIGIRESRKLKGMHILTADELKSTVHFEDTVAIPRNDIEDDQYGIYSMLIAQMGYNAGKLWQQLAVEALLSETNWIDGTAFFSTSRTYGGETISNKTSATLSAADYATARAAMMSYKGHNGKPLGIVPNLLIVGPSNEATAFSILKDRLMLKTHSASSISGVGATENPWNGSAELLVLPELTGSYADYWFLCATSGVLKPVFVQQRKQPVLTCLDHDSDENVFARKEYIYGSDARGEAFLAFPHLIYRGGKA